MCVLCECVGVRCVYDNSVSPSHTHTLEGEQTKTSKFGISRNLKASNPPIPKPCSPHPNP